MCSHRFMVLLHLECKCNDKHFGNMSNTIGVCTFSMDVCMSSWTCISNVYIVYGELCVIILLYIEAYNMKYIVQHLFRFLYMHECSFRNFPHGNTGKMCMYIYIHTNPNTLIYIYIYTHNLRRHMWTLLCMCDVYCFSIFLNNRICWW